MRMVYKLMRYRVRHEGEFSEDDISSGIGILTGDTMSSEFWKLFFGDLNIPVTDDDIMLAGIAISHLEQADDLLLLALSPKGLQCKMNLFYIYCGNNFLLINAIKSAIGYHGPAPPVSHLMPIFYFNGEQVKIVDKYTYVGMTYKSGPYRNFSSVLELHYLEKAKKARKIGHAVLHIESMIGALPAHEGKILYTGCIDPHLIYGCEVAIDTSKALTDHLVGVQLSFFRRLLGLSKTSIKVSVYTETGIPPIQLRRLELALSTLQYLLDRSPDMYVRAALNESIALNSAGKKSWLGDLKEVVSIWLPNYKLPSNQSLTDAADGTILGKFNEAITSATNTWIQDELERVKKRSYLIQLRKEPTANGETKYRDACLRTYLKDIDNSQHLKAMTRLIAGDHSLAVVRLTWTDNHRIQVPYDERLCRFCRLSVETPEHALLDCTHVPLAIRRHTFFNDFYNLYPNAVKYTLNKNKAAYVGYLISCQISFSIVAKWIFDVLKIYDSTPLYVPTNYMRNHHHH
jgi:hypothetical protein